MPPSLFAAVDAAASAAIDSAFTERVELFPLAKGRTDGSRQTIIVDAVVRMACAERAQNATGGGDLDWTQRISASQIEIDVDRRKYPDLRIEDGDRVRALDWPNKPFWTVAHLNDRIPFRFVLALAEA